MKILPSSTFIEEPERFRKNNTKAHAFTLTEVMVGASILGLSVTLLISFVFATMNNLIGISNQAYINRKAGYGVEYIASRIRAASYITNDVSGERLSLGFDDNVLVDSGTDGITYNDADHWEYIFYEDTDNNATTTADNKLNYQAVVGQNTYSFYIFDSGVKKLPGLNIFNVTNNIIVEINFGVFNSTLIGRTQSIEMKTKSVARNVLQE
ncbi:MAG TPA: type II secretion system protein [Verrucomicrobiales bacterium]|nr:type II secretion system protein [Verrucomicrobiales bacterium]